MMNADIEHSPAHGRRSNVNDPVEQLHGVGETSVYPSAAWRRMMAWVRRVASTRLPVLIQGESGSGKEAVARAIHHHAEQRHGPFVAVNCTAVTETLLEAELFGAVRGAYTGSERDRPGLFRRAHGGTLLLDEVGDMPATMQAKLLRALESGRVLPVGALRRARCGPRRAR